MRKFTRKAIWGALLALVIATPLYLAAQSYLYTVQGGGMQFQSSSPVMRWVGTLAFQNLAGTTQASIDDTGIISGLKSNAIVTTASTDALTAAECGSVIVANATTGTQTFTLPAASNAGCMFKFIAGHAGGEILVNAAAVATCVITTFAAVGTDADTAIVTDASCETGLKNTAASNAIGDSLTLVSDGTRWLGVGITSGIWATQ